MRTVRSETRRSRAKSASRSRKTGHETLDTDAVALRVIRWLKTQVSKAGASGAVVGLSGGVDSAVVAVLCKRAFPETMRGLIMPCNSLKQDLRLARQLAEAFCIPYDIIDLTDVFGSFCNLLEHRYSREAAAAVANIKPRLRMITLYYCAQLYNYLVAGTGNKSEKMLGYFTKYGDGGVDLMPIGNLLKTEVVALAKHLKIPPGIVERSPSAGLWSGQTDEGEFGMSYHEIDRAIQFMEGRSAGARPDIVERVKGFIKSSQHKRTPIPSPRF